MTRWMVLAALVGRVAFAGNGSEPLGEAVLERPTLHSLGVYWIVRGDENQNASVSLEYRAAGETAWHNTLGLMRVERGAHVMEKYKSTLEAPGDGWLFAGSALLLKPGTEYELRVKLADPDGGGVEKVLRQKTREEPELKPGGVFKWVVPGNGGGTGTADDPFRGLAAAQASASAGDRFMLMPGTYEGVFEVKVNGEEGNPIVWRGSAEGEVILDARGSAARRPGRAISVSDAHDVWFENLSIINADWGIVAHDSSRIVIRRCHIHQVDYGITATRDDRRRCNDLFISDNIIEGPCSWPRTRGIENPRGIQVSGAGHEVCYNRIRGFSDAIDTFPSGRCSAIDFHHNDVSECTDDGMEMDYSERNTRCFLNRFTNVFQGISIQPVYGGPTYIFRNALYNIEMEPIKMHNSPSGVYIMHNTFVKKGVPLLVYTSEKVRNVTLRNNLFIGTDGNYAIEMEPPMIGCDFDYDGFGGGPYKLFAKWNQKRYASFDELRGKAPVYRHAVRVDNAAAFKSGVVPPDDPKKLQSVVDLRLGDQSGALDGGVVLPGINDGFKGKAPDLGAYELGDELPWYGPRPAARR